MVSQEHVFVNTEKRIFLIFNLLLNGLGVLWRYNKGGDTYMKTNLGNKQVMAKNLAFYVERSGKSQKELAEVVGVSTSTFNDWMKGKNYPRIDKIEMLANFFGILKSDLIEDYEEMQKKNDVMADIIQRMRSDETFLSMVQKLYALNPENLSSADEFLSVFLKQFQNQVK